MDSIYKQTRTWMSSRGALNASSTNWVGLLSARDPGPERSTLSMAGWSPYDKTSRRPLLPDDMPPAPQRPAGTRWNRDQSEWNETRGGPEAGPNSWSGPSNGNARVMQNQPQQQQSMQMQINSQEPPKGHAEGFLQGFSSAGRDWFYRYLNMGCSPEEARDRVLERNRNHPESLDFTITPHGGRYADANDCRNPADDRYADANDRRNPADDRYADANDRRNPAADRYADAKDRRNPADDRYADAKDRRNPTEERKRPSESGLDSIGSTLKTLNLGCRKWYYKHLESGLTPKEAIAKVLEYKRTHSGSQPVQSSIDAGGRKRPVDSKARDDPNKPKRGKDETEAPGNDPLAVAIVAKNYPRHYLNKPELAQIVNALMEEMQNGWTCSLNFGGIKYRPGMLVVNCLDEGSKDWLAQVVPKITCLQGIALRIYREDELFNSRNITFYVPRAVDEPDEVTLRFINEQNTDLLSGTWSIVRSGQAKQSLGKVMTLKISDKSLDLISKRGMYISYRFTQLSCHIAHRPSSKKKKAVDQTPANPPEIDLTAEDEDIELSEMTVLDEIQCDDDDENDELPEQDEYEVEEVQ